MKSIFRVIIEVEEGEYKKYWDYTEILDLTEETGETVTKLIPVVEDELKEIDNTGGLTKRTEVRKDRTQAMSVTVEGLLI